MHLGYYLEHEQVTPEATVLFTKKNSDLFVIHTRYPEAGTISSYALA
jgi:hypothetical protein